jgi:hypothetical protein
MITSLVSTFCGALFGGFQNYLEKKQDSTREIQIAKIQADKDIELAKQGVVVSQNALATQESTTSQEEFKTEASLKQSDTEEYKAFSEAVTQTSALWNSQSLWSNIANFIISTTRPIITYLLGGLVFVLAYQISQYESITDQQLEIFDLVLAEFSAAMSYWFVRRSFEKRQTPSFVALKKKLK